jgi:hypothetical protein
MAKRSSFLFRTDPRVLSALKRWSADEFRSVNGQLEFILCRALQDAGRLKSSNPGDNDTEPDVTESEA